VRGQRGQASLELLAGVPALLLAGLVALQLLATAYTLHLADGAAEAGALALAAGAPPTPAARAALPDWAAGRVRVTATGGRVAVAVRPPGPLPGISEALEVESSAWARPADG
jgi:hypothetical protein